MKFLIKTKCGETLISDDLTSEYPLFFSETDVISFGSIGVHKDNLLYYMPYEEPNFNTTGSYPEEDLVRQIRESIKNGI